MPWIGRRPLANVPPSLPKSRASEAKSGAVRNAAARPAGAARQAVSAGLSRDFRDWLAKKGPKGFDFVRADVPGGSFGGRVHSERPSGRPPVVFVHGNSDSALGTGKSRHATGWCRSVDALLAKGYSSGELYGTTWGPADAHLAYAQRHTRANVMQVRKFLEAVLAYTGAPQISVVSHSMGVTLARKAIKGGSAVDPESGERYDVGPPLTDKVDVFVGIAGANQGLASGFFAPAVPTTSPNGGLFPGVWTPFGVVGRSDFLDDLLETSGYEGKHRFSIWSRSDELSPMAGLVWGKPSARIPGQSGEKVFNLMSHVGLKDKTTDVQARMLIDRRA